VRVRLYERAKLLEGDIRRDFCQAIGLAAPTGLSFNDAEDNPSLDFDSVQFLSRLNAMQLPEPRRAQLVGILKQRAATQASKSLFAPRERLGIFERFREGNRAFAQEFLGAPDALDLTLDELLADVPLDFGYGRARFVSTLAEVLPRLLPHAAA
jgi:hypothetical protein